MMDRAKILFSTSIFLFLLFNSPLNLLVRSSFAGLGDIEESVTSDQTKIFSAKASSSTTANGNVRMHEIKQKTQTVHEYVSKDGKVFAVTWKGPVHPDLSVLFGSYFKDFQDAREVAQRQQIRRRSGMLESGDLHVEYGGHMAAQQGRAWVKSLLPTGFDTDEIR